MSQNLTLEKKSMTHHEMCSERVVTKPHPGRDQHETAFGLKTHTHASVSLWFT